MMVTCRLWLQRRSHAWKWPVSCRDAQSRGRIKFPGRQKMESSMRARWLYAGAFAMLALTSGAAVAQGNGNGHGRDNAPGQVKKGQSENTARFADHDRVSANTWYAQNRRSLPRGMRDRDRVPAEQQSRIAPGYVFDRNMRGQVYPAPYSLRRHFAPAPRGYRYVIYGGHVMLVDDGYRVFDTIRLNINLGG
jgi:hypothetical protein